MEKRKLVFIGSGNITKSIISGLINSNYPPDLIRVCSPSNIKRNILVEKYKIKGSHNNLKGISEADIIIFAIKPYHIKQVCNELYKRVNFHKKIIISLVAGIKLNKFYDLLGCRNIKIIRVMTNINCSINQGMSGIYTSSILNENDKLFITKLMFKLGKVLWLKSEKDINLIISAASSAPAYFFLFMEIIEQKIKKLGFDENIAHSIVLQTALGTIELAKQYKKCSFFELRKQVTSKKGTTDAAIRIFNKYKLNEIISSAMDAVISRAKEIESLF